LEKVGQLEPESPDEVSAGSRLDVDVTALDPLRARV
jgi:hypothetical protein